MTTYSRRELVTTRVEYRIPAWPGGAAWVEVYKAVAAAHAELRAAGELRDGQDAPDDRIWIVSADEEIVVWFVAPEKVPS